MQPEESLDSQISAALADDPRTTHAVIDVACVGGQVTLAGAVTLSHLRAEWIFCDMYSTTRPARRRHTTKATSAGPAW
jgi:hypothetical protein